MAQHEKVTKALDQLKNAVGNFENDTEYLAFLAQMGKFHRYSWRNSLLIQIQRPDASHVAGFKKWLEMGRCVRKGEKAMTILAPRTFTKEKEQPDGTTKEEKGIYFVHTNVFDVAQTDVIEAHPDPFLPFSERWKLTEEVGGELVALLVAHMEREGVSVSFGDCGGAHGWYSPSSKEIRVRPDAMLRQLKTLIHEIAHHYVKQVESYEPDRAHEEVIVESVAYAVCSYMGLDTGRVSIPYVSSWLQHDRKGFEKGLREMQQVTHKIIDIIEGTTAGDSENPLADAA